MGIFSGITDMFKEKKSTPEYSVIADDFKDVREPLLKYLHENIGKVNSYSGEMTAGATPQETQSLDYLKKYTDSGVSDLRTKASGEISKTLSGDYDPTTSPYYQAVKAEAARNLKDTQENIASKAAGGGRFWTGARLERQGEAATDVNNALNTLVYGMQEKERQNRLNIIPQALSAAGQEEEIPLQKATALQTLGSLDRNIQQSRLDALYDEWIRANNTQPMDVAKLAAGFGGMLTPDRAETKRLPSTAMAMLGEINPIAGSYNTAKYGYTKNQNSLSNSMGGDGNLAKILKMISMGGA